jgi:RNA polymerase sigma-70 factor (ECF subfamily)
VQETAIGVARRLPQFVYDPKVCRFKTWLLNLTRWRIQDQLRKRQEARPKARPPSEGPEPAKRSLPLSDTTASTATIECIPDPAVAEFGAEWDVAWEKNLLAQALERVRDRIDERQFQLFDLYVMKGWSPKEVAQTFGISAARVYLTKHRVSGLVKKEVRRLAQHMERQLSSRKLSS